MRRLTPRAIVAGALAWVAAWAVALPAGAAAETVTWRYNGDAAGAAFKRVDGCTTTWLSLLASDVRFTGNQRTTFPPDVYVFLQRYSPCTFGWRWTTDLVPLPAGALSIRGDLASATLHATVPFRDETIGATVPLRLDLVWKATVPLRRVDSDNHVIVDGVQIAGSDLRTRDYADVSGLVSAGSDTWTTDDATGGGLVAEHFGSVAISR